MLRIASRCYGEHPEDGRQATGEALGDERETYTSLQAADAVSAYVEAIQDLGRAEKGDKTLIDAALPFQQTLREAVEAGTCLADAWAAASAAARTAADATAGLLPRKGRARPLAEKSLGTPDAGAQSFALLVAALAGTLRRHGQGGAAHGPAAEPAADFTGAGGNVPPRPGTTDREKE